MNEVCIEVPVKEHTMLCARATLQSSSSSQQIRLGRAC